MRVLLYEPGVTGHRTVILKYVTKLLVRFGWHPIVCKQDFEAHRRSSLRMVLREAHRTSADCVHILTADGSMSRWCGDLMPVINRAVPIVCTYYLFNNL